MTEFAQNSSEKDVCTIAPRESGGFLLNGPDMEVIEIYTSPTMADKDAPVRWITIEKDPHDNSFMMEIEHLDNLIKALTSIRDAQRAA